MSKTKWTTTKIKACKGREKIVSLTAYDYSTARIMDEVGIHIVLVGDSLGMTVLGYDDTLPVTLEDMLHHTAAVVRGVKQAMVVGDMPFLSYQVSIDQAIDNAGRFLKEARADVVKIEGGAFRSKTITALVENGIPVMGHIGLTPQSVRAMGGYKVQGKTDDSISRLKDDAQALEDAGVFSLVLEGMPVGVAQAITKMLEIPTIGIGAGPHCDGQVLVVQDMLGIFSNLKPKFIKQYAALGEEMSNAFRAFKKEVHEGVFPGTEHGY
ncbi:MAG: 3-methyl-2-oxobutanoate hydroxymethyltransferase [Kiritimatiellae bacterium]|nr:3-methyl-2-oxobutanoate hydroxymethyltransferase [Kiritimatiellia bacterium]